MLFWQGMAGNSRRSFKPVHRRFFNRLIRPGIDLITLDPKLSSTIIGEEAFVDDATVQHVASRVALDVGFYNQEGCLNARVVYVKTGTDAAGLDKAHGRGRVGALVNKRVAVLPDLVNGDPDIVGDGPAASHARQGVDQVDRPDPCLRFTPPALASRLR